jgi:hypothetical protein
MVDTAVAPEPYAIVWAPIPILSWIYPMIGHLGIAKSDGDILDFAVTVRERDMAFGGPARYLPLRPEAALILREQIRESAARLAGQAKSLATLWDENVDFTADVYRRREYSFLHDNCHHFVAHFLNSVRYDSRQWTHLRLAWAVASKGRWVWPSGFVRVVLPAVVTLGLAWRVLGATALALSWTAGLVGIALWFSVFMGRMAGASPRNMLLQV